jgi:ABC-type multidrug transport system ATPase subunit
MGPIKNECDVGYMIHKHNDHFNKNNRIRMKNAKGETKDSHSQSAISDKQSKDLADQEATSYQFPQSAHGTKRHHSQHTIRIDAIGLKRLGKNRAILLNNISLSIPGGALVAVVGASGAGKSTLLNVISGFQVPQKGKVLYGGRDYYRDLSVYRKQVGYVPQENIVHQNLTVERALYYAAQMRLPIGYTKKDIKQRISEVLDAVDLTARRHMRVNKLSGGQKKRVSIALELLDKPKVFFLDEPTSGLDAGLDNKMMHLLRQLANKQQTILVATHTTNNLTLCDYICFLAPGGRLAYFGPPDRALKFFGTDTFAQVYTMLEPNAKFPHAPEVAESWFKASADYQTYIGSYLKEIDATEVYWSKRSTPPPPERCSAWKQFWLLSLRYLEVLKNDPGSLLVLLLQAPVIVLLLIALMKYDIGTGMFNQTSIATCPTTAHIFTSNGQPNIPDPNNPVISYNCNRVQHMLENVPEGRVYAIEQGGEMQALQNFIAIHSGIDAEKVLFIMSFSAMLFGCVNAAREIAKEAPIYRRERAVNLDILPYIFSKIVVLGLLCLLQDAILAASVNAIAPFPQGILLPAVFEIGITLWLTSLSGLMIGLTISAIAPTTDRAMNFLPIVLIPQVIFSGTIFPFKSWSTQILALLFTCRWSMGALGTTISLHSDKLGGDKLLGQLDIYNGTLFSIYTHADAVQHLLLMWKALGVIIILLICAVGTILKLKDKA